MARTGGPITEPQGAGRVGAVDSDILIQVTDLKKHFPVRKGMLTSVLGGGTDEYVKAVDGVSFELKKGEALGLAGESGCGKTTTGRLLLRLLEPTDGRIEFEGRNVSELSGAGLLEFRRASQLMFQNPYEALSPRFKTLRAVMEPLLIHKLGTEEERLERVFAALEAVNLQPAETYIDQYPHQLSGGQLQRVVLARALVLQPKFLVADEPVSMLDVSVRAGVLNLMRRISRDMKLSTLYISHDLSLIRYMCQRTAIMYLGRIAEIGPTDAIIEQPKHPYAQALVSAVPLPDPDMVREHIEIKDTVPSPINLPPGCRFQDRCPFVMDRCRETEPELVEVGDNHYAACFLYGDHQE